MLREACKIADDLNITTTTTPPSPSPRALFVPQAPDFDFELD
jgi:hypothetical protein